MKLPVEGMMFDDYPNGSVTQWYGENPEIYRLWGMKAHNGIDIVAPWGTPLYAIEAGVIVDHKDDPKGFGKHIRLRSKQAVNGLYREWTYGHLSEISVEPGQVVKEGQMVGKMGNTGFVISGATPFWEYNPYAGVHTHFQLRLLRPSKTGWRYPYDTLKVDVENYDNGYKGAVDPMTILGSLRPGDKRPKMLTLLSLLNQTVTLLQKLKK